MDHVRQTIVIELPKGSRFLSLPADARFEYSGCWASFTFRNDEAGRIICECEYAPTPVKLDGATVQGFDSFARKLEAKQRKTIPITAF
jgi:hypothetical protein